MDAGASRRTAELDAADEEDIADASEGEQSLETQALHTKNVLELSNQAEVAAHDAAHCTYRSCCPMCVAATPKRTRTRGLQAWMSRADCQWCRSIMKLRKRA